MLSKWFYVVFDKILGLVNKRIHFLLYVVLSGSFLLMLAMRIALIFSYAPDISVGEDNNVWNVQKVLCGKPLYTNPEEAPFEVFQYSPLSQYPVIWTAKILNLKPGVDEQKIFETGRIYSLIYILLCIGILFYALRKWFYVSNVFALMAAVISFAGLTQLSFTFRPDALLSLTFISALLFFLKFMKDTKNSSLIIASFLAVLALFSKQNGIQLPIIFITFSFIFCEFRTTVKVTVYYLFFFIILFLLFYSLYGTQFLIATIGGINNPIDIIYGYQVWDNFFFKYMPFVILGIFISFIFLQKEKSNMLKFTAISIIATFFFALVTILKQGSWINYFSEFFIIGNIAVALFLQKQTENTSLNAVGLKLGLLIFILFWGLNTFVHQYFHRHAEHLSSQPKIQYDKEKEVADFLELQNIPKGSYIFTPLKHLKNLIPQFSILPNTEYYTTSKLDFSLVKKYTENGKISYIILNEQDYPKYRTIVQMKMKIENYSVIKTINNILILRYINA